jgi:hypothetical protein
MASLFSSRILRTVSLFASVAALPGCIIEGGHTPRNNLVDGPAAYAGCPSLQGVGNSGLVGLTAERGGYFSFASFSYPNEYIRHYQGRGIVAPVYSALDGDDATFRVVPGLADNRCISFESANYPGYYLNDDGGEVFLDAAAPGLTFAEDATFCPRPGLADPYELSFESCAYPGSFLRQDAGDLFVEGGAGLIYEDDATFLIDAPF